MMRRVTETYRIVPPRLRAIASLALALWALLLIGWLAFEIGATSPGVFLLLAAALLLLAALCTVGFLPDSPIDFLEVGPDGLTVGGVFGRRHRRWQDIESFSAFLFPNRGMPLVWVKAIARQPGRPNMRFSMGGYVKLGWFEDVQERQRELSDWFENVKAAYTGGNHSGSLPGAPEWFVGRLT